MPTPTLRTGAQGQDFLRRVPGRAQGGFISNTSFGATPDSDAPAPAPAEAVRRRHGTGARQQPATLWKRTGSMTLAKLGQSGDEDPHVIQRRRDSWEGTDELEELDGPNFRSVATAAMANRGAHWKIYIQLPDGSKVLFNGLRPFGEARAIALNLGLPVNVGSDAVAEGENKRAWQTWCSSESRGPDIPWDPSKTYKDKGWVSWGHFLHRGEDENPKPKSLGKVLSPTMSGRDFRTL